MMVKKKNPAGVRYIKWSDFTLLPGYPYIERAITYPYDYRKKCSPVTKDGYVSVAAIYNMSAWANWKSSSLGVVDRKISEAINNLRLYALMKLNKGRRSNQPALFPIRLLENPTLVMPIKSKKQLEHLFKAQSQLHKAGVTFDTGTQLVKPIERHWELDWSLKGAKMRNPISPPFPRVSVYPAEYLKTHDVYEKLFKDRDIALHTARELRRMGFEVDTKKWRDPFEGVPHWFVTGIRGKMNPKRKLSVPEQHQLRIAKDALRMPDAMVGVMGGPTKAQAREIIKRLTGGTPKGNPRKERKYTQTTGNIFGGLGLFSIIPITAFIIWMREKYGK